MVLITLSSILFCTFSRLALVASYTHQDSEVTIGATAAFSQKMMRRQARAEDVQTPRIAKSTTITTDTSQVKPNIKLCACNGCLLPSGYCSSIWSRFSPSSLRCKQQNGTWCADNRTSLWEVPSECQLARKFVSSNTSLTMLQVTMTALPFNGWNKVKFQLTDTETYDSTIALLPCITEIPDILQARNASVWVQGYYEENGDTVRQFLALNGVPTEFRRNSTYFIILNVQDTDSLVSDVEKKTQDQVSTATMAGALRPHWFPEMKVAVALVTCPGTALNANRTKVKEAFFTEFASALASISRGNIKVSGDVTDVVIDCPSNTSKSDVYSYFQAVNAALKSNQVWVLNDYKAMVIPNGWMATYGLAYSPGKLSWYTDLGAEDAANIMHEMGHNFGLDHAAVIPSSNPTGYDENGDCSSAMSKCDRVLTYNLASMWFLGFNTFQREISVTSINSPISIKINSQSQQRTSGVLLTKTVNGIEIPAFTVSYFRKWDVPLARRTSMSDWLEKVFVHELPKTPYGQTKNIAILSKLDVNKRSLFFVRDISLAVRITLQDRDSAVVKFCRARSMQEAQQVCRDS
jgi:hypothetical protein